MYEYRVLIGSGKKLQVSHIIIQPIAMVESDALRIMIMGKAISRAWIGSVFN